MLAYTFIELKSVQQVKNLRKNVAAFEHFANLDSKKLAFG